MAEKPYRDEKFNQLTVKIYFDCFLLEISDSDQYYVQNGLAITIFKLNHS